MLKLKGANGMFLVFILLTAIGLTIFHFAYQSVALPAFHQIFEAKFDNLIAETKILLQEDKIKKHDQAEIEYRMTVMKGNLHAFQLVDFILYVRNHKKNEVSNHRYGEKTIKDNEYLEQINAKTRDIIFAAMLTNSGFLLVLFSPFLLLLPIISLMGMKKSPKERIVEYSLHQYC